MKKLTLMTTTAIIAGYMAFATPAMATESTWFDTMTNSVQSWFTTDTTTTEVEAYLDEVTIAVPPMTGEEAAAIQPAAGDYIEAMEEDAMQPSVAPGSMLNDQQSFNTEFDNTQGSIAAFEDRTFSADDMANIMPAAGDAEEITDEAVVTVESKTGTMDATTMENAVEEIMNNMENHANDTMMAK